MHYYEYSESSTVGIHADFYGYIKSPQKIPTNFFEDNKLRIELEKYAIEMRTITGKYRVKGDFWLFGYKEISEANYYKGIDTNTPFVRNPKIGDLVQDVTWSWFKGKIMAVFPTKCLVLNSNGEQFYIDNKHLVKLRGIDLSFYLNGGKSLKWDLSKVPNGSVIDHSNASNLETDESFTRVPTNEEIKNALEIELKKLYNNDKKLI